MKIAIVQSDIQFENKNHNISSAQKQIEFSAINQADLVCFPEMSFTGFSMNTSKTAETDFYTQNKISEFCRQYNITIAFGWVKAVENSLSENHYTIIDKTGTVIADYIKIHPFSYGGENLFFQSGKSLSFFPCKNRTISPFICYDLRFPEIFQAASKKADILLIAANWPYVRENHWKILLQARAIETQSIVVGINCVGQQKNTIYGGASSVFNADGTLLYQCGNTEQTALIDIPNSVTEIRKEFAVKQDRKEDLYTHFFGI